MGKKALQLLREYALPVLFAEVRALAEAAERNANYTARRVGDAQRVGVTQ